MKPETLDQPAPMRAGSLPRAVWIGGATLCLVTAALAGALVSKSIDSPSRVEPTPPAMVGNVDPAPRTGTPVPPLAQDEAPPVPNSVRPVTAATPATQVATPAPVRVATTNAAPARAAAPALCAQCGTVESVQAVKVKGQGSGVGAVAGGVLGGVVGNQFGHGNGKAAMTVLGAVGGGFAGNEVERRTRGETLFDVQVRMRDGSRRVIRESQPPAVGTPVAVEGKRLRVLNG